MKFSSQCVSFWTVIVAAATTVLVVDGEEASCVVSSKPPYISPKVTMSGHVIDNIKSLEADYKMSEVLGCCSQDYKLQSIGQMPQMTTSQTIQILEDAKKAWDGGMGIWPQMSLSERIHAIRAFLNELQSSQQRELIIQTLMWEIGKNYKDAESEFDRTIKFANEVINVVESDPEFGKANWRAFGGGKTNAFTRRAAIGIIMCLGPMNYPLNETYATLIPALLMGNVAIMKIPTVGGLSHLLTMEAFAKTLPKGTMNFVSGRGRDTMPPLMGTGDIDALAFIGGSNAADDLIKQHPHPHRLKVFLQLEAKNMGIFFPDLFDKSKADELDKALDQAVLGALSFNGQRCTALKLFFVPKSSGDSFAKALAAKIENLKVGLPWQTFDENDTSFANITPLPSQKQLKRMKNLILDALSKGATIINKDGGNVIGGSESTLMVPAVLYPVTPDMDIYNEEQFGPVVPITTYDDYDEFVDYAKNGIYGQQVSLFLSTTEVESAASTLDKFSSIFGKININSQCGRSPDNLPFSGRRSSAMGVMSVRHALMEFSIPTVVSYKDSDVNAKIVNQMEKSSNFLESLATE